MGGCARICPHGRRKHPAMRLLEKLRQEGVPPGLREKLNILLGLHKGQGGVQDPSRAGLDQAEYIISAEVELLPDEVQEVDSWFIREFTRLAEGYVGEKSS